MNPSTSLVKVWNSGVGVGFIVGVEVGTGVDVILAGFGEGVVVTDGEVAVDEIVGDMLGEEVAIVGVSVTARVGTEVGVGTEAMEAVVSGVFLSCENRINPTRERMTKITVR